MKEQVWIGLWSNFRRRALRCFLYAAMMGMLVVICIVSRAGNWEFCRA